MTKENLNKFNKKFIVTALGVAALGFQLMQTNNVKADTAADSKTGDAASEDTVETKDSSVADDSSIQKDIDSTTETDGTDGTSSYSKTDTDNDQQQNDNTDTTMKNLDTQSQDGKSNSSENTDQDNNDTNQESNDVNDDSNSGTSNDDTIGKNSETDTESNPNTDGSQANEDVNGNQDADSQDSNVDTSNILVQKPTADGDVNNYKDPVKTSASVIVTNENGTASSKSTDDDKNSNVIVYNNSSVTLNYKIVNTSDQSTGNYGTDILLPAYNWNNSITISKDADLTEAFKDLPAGVKITYDTTTGGSRIAYDGTTNVDPSTIKEIYIDPNGTSIEAGQSLNINLPLTNNNTSTHQNNKAKIGVYILNPYYRWDNLNITFKNQDDNISNDTFQGQYPAYTVNQLGISYTAADQEIQNKMPIYSGGSDIQIDNFNTYNKDLRVDADKTDLTYGGVTYVDLVHSGITEIANNDGYSVLLNSDGSQQTEYSYQDYGYDAGVSLLPNSNDNDDSETNSTKTIGTIYITLRHVINAQDGTTKVGQNWTAADNLTSVQDNDDNVLTGNDAISAITTTINDQDGVLQDGKVVKAGTFEVTYTYNLKDGTAITKTVTVTADPATNNSGSSSSSSSSSSNTSSNSSSNNSSSTTDPTDPVVSPDSPDNINDQDRLVSTHPADGVVSLYKLDTTKITNRSLNTASDWYSDKDMTFAGETYYRVATNEWVKASNVYVYQNKSQVIQTNNNQQLVDSKGNTVTNRSLLANTAWYTDRIATINGKSYYRVATNEFVPIDAVTVM